MIPTLLLSACLLTGVNLDRDLSLDVDARVGLQPTIETAHNEPDEGSGEASASPTQPFGLQGQTYLTLGAGAAYGLEEEDATDINIHAAWSNFLADDVEFALELAAWYHNQEGQDTASINPQVVFRWHFINRDSWTLFADVGIGVLLATDNTPSGGTGFNFTPRAGVGGTWRLNDEGVRLQAGVRWHHISNARINGETRNPDRDGIMGYVALQFPL